MNEAIELHSVWHSGSTNFVDKTAYASAPILVTVRPNRSGVAR